MKVTIEYYDREKNVKHISLNDVDYCDIEEREPKTLRVYKAKQNRKGDYHPFLVYEKRVKYIKWFFVC